MVTTNVFVAVGVGAAAVSVAAASVACEPVPLVAAASTVGVALAAGGARVTVCPRAAEGMGASLAWGVRAAPIAAGWLIALADMPWIQTVTISRVADAVRAGAPIAAPSWKDSRGHPVGLASRFFGELAALAGDEGAKAILRRHHATLIATDDAGVLRDVDTPQDLEG